MRNCCLSKKNKNEPYVLKVIFLPPSLKRLLYRYKIAIIGLQNGKRKLTMAHSIGTPPRSITSRPLLLFLEALLWGKLQIDQRLLENRVKSFALEIGRAPGWISFCKFSCTHGTM